WSVVRVTIEEYSSRTSEETPRAHSRDTRRGPRARSPPVLDPFPRCPFRHLPEAPMSDPIAALHRFAAPSEPLAVLLIGFGRLDADALRARLARLAQRMPIPRDLEVVVCPTADAEAAR